MGRGEGSKGKTAGRGTKGTKARKNVPATFEGGQMPIHMRLPKLKGFRNRFRTEYEVVNVGDINRLFPEGGDVGVDELVAAGAVRKNALVKVLGDGKLTVKVNVTAHKFSGSAREKITAAGGQRHRTVDPSISSTQNPRRSGGGSCVHGCRNASGTGSRSTLRVPISQEHAMIRHRRSRRRRDVVAGSPCSAAPRPRTPRPQRRALHRKRSSSWAFTCGSR